MTTHTATKNGVTPNTHPLRTLLDHTYVTDTKLLHNPTMHFVFRGKRISGLTRWVSRCISVPKHSSSTCKRCSYKRGGKHVTKKKCGMTQAGRTSKKMRKFCVKPCTMPVISAVSPHRSITERKDTERKDTLPEAQLRCRGKGARGHGMLVDAQLTEAATSSLPLHQFITTTTMLDPCVRTLLQYLDTKGLRIAATQVPLYMPSFRRATAIDLLCVDVATGKRVTLVEVKATRDAHVPQVAACYEHVTNGATLSCGIPLSRYGQHQLQLFCMWHTLVNDMHVPIDEALVIRTNAASVDVYPLHAHLQTRAHTITHALTT